MTKLEVEFEHEAISICATFQLKYAKVRYSRLDDILYVFVNGKQQADYQIFITKWMKNLKAQPNINAPGCTSPFLKTQIQYHGKPS